MAKLIIRKVPDGILTRRVPEIYCFDTRLKTLADNMIETMRASTTPAVGLSANQVGVELRIIVVDASKGRKKPKVFINPEITGFRGHQTAMEGCLSIPGITRRVTRPARINLRYRDLKGDLRSRKCSNLLARVVCHEIDHLDGILISSKPGGA